MPQKKISELALGTLERSTQLVGINNVGEVQETKRYAVDDILTEARSLTLLHTFETPIGEAFEASFALPARYKEVFVRIENSTDTDNTGSIQMRANDASGLYVMQYFNPLKRYTAIRMKLWMPHIVVDAINTHSPSYYGGNVVGRWGNSQHRATPTALYMKSVANFPQKSTFYIYAR